MTIKRVNDPSSVGEVIIIKLTPTELYQAYLEQKKEFCAQDIAQNIADRIEDAGAEAKFHENLPMNIGWEYAETLMERANEDDYLSEVYAGVVDDVVNEAFRDMGIDLNEVEVQ